MTRIEALKNKIRKSFPDAEPARVFFGRQNLNLEEIYGFTPENTRFAEGGCSDEINEAELIFMERYWGERFKFGGLAGYCHGGKTGLSAVSHHVPEVDGQKNLLLLAGTHIGFHEGLWGKVPRKGQERLTASCGSLSAAVAAGYETLKNRELDPLDRQQCAVEQIMLPYLERCTEAGQVPDIVEATRFLQRRIDKDLSVMVAGLEKNFGGRIALITGITINTSQGNFFSPSIVEMRGAASPAR
jgi:hypothetical protein